jgi:hypothetical protein
MTPPTGKPDVSRSAEPRRAVEVLPAARSAAHAEASESATKAPSAKPSSTNQASAKQAPTKQAPTRQAGTKPQVPDAWAIAAGLKATAIDTLMERASQALVACDYFRAAELCERALDKSVASADFERAARAILPLQEARRQLRHLATDAASTPAGITACKAMPREASQISPGFVLLEPPLVGIDAGQFRELAQRAKCPALVLVKEPTTKAGLWPIVGVGKGEPFPVVVRVLLQPPEGIDAKAPLTHTLSSARRDTLIAWMLQAQEALGDAAIAKVNPAWPADHRVLDLAEFLAAVPDHEKLAQAFAAACREAAVSPPSPLPRRRTIAENKYSF